MVCVALLGLGCALRGYDLAYPRDLTFDEDHFVVNARNYLAGSADKNDHPPLGKLLIAVGLIAAGDNSFGWRIVPLVLGLTSLALAYALGKEAFRSPLAGWLAAAFVAADGAQIVYSRTALLDGILTTFALACGLLLVRRPEPVRMVGAGAAAGAAMAIKFTGGALLLAIAVAALARPHWRRRLWLAALGMSSAVVAYYAAHALGLALTHKGWTPGDVWADTVRLVVGHSKQTTSDHPLSSQWYTWFVPLRPITLREIPVGMLRVRKMVLLGNPLLWWSATMAALATAVWLCWLGLRQALTRIRKALWGAREGASSDARGDDAPASWAGVALLVVLWLCLILPWVLSSRDSYLYHYVPPYAFALVLLGGLVSQLYRRRPLLGLIAVLAVANVSAYYAPIWGQLPITEEAAGDRLFLKVWR